jgi:hypothetical protein
VDRVWIRSAAISCAFASCAIVVGPGGLGIAQSHAILGIGPDLLDLFGNDDDKSSQHHPRPGSEDSSGQAARTVGITTADAGPPVSTFGSAPESADARQLAAAADTAGIPSAGVAERGGGGGGLPRTNIAVRAGNLPRVSTAPLTRSIVIRGAPQSNAVTGIPAPAFVPPTLGEAPVVVPLAAPPPVVPEPEGRPAPGAPPAPSPLSPIAKDPLASKDSGATRIPDSFRAGYAEYLRSANNTDLFIAALPGVAGIAGFTLLGAYAGYRQARAVQAALLAPVPTQVLL